MFENTPVECLRFEAEGKCGERGLYPESFVSNVLRRTGRGTEAILRGTGRKLEEEEEKNRDVEGEVGSTTAVPSSFNNVNSREELRCLFCLSSCGPGKFENAKQSSTRDVTAYVKILLKYLLDSRSKKNEELLAVIIRMLEDSGKRDKRGDHPGIGECNECIEGSQRLWDLHRQLEVIQMKIVEGLKLFRGKILQHFVSDGRGEELGGIREPSVTTTEEGVAGAIVSHAIEAFRRAVCEKGREAVDVPCVILDKFSYSNKLTEIGGNDATNVTVKREPEVDACNSDNDFDDFPPPEEDPGVPSELHLVPEPRCKRKRGCGDPKDSSSCEPQGNSMNCKFEAEEPKPKRRRRSVSLAESPLTAKTGKGSKSPGRKEYKKRAEPQKYKKRWKDKPRYMLVCELCPFSNTITYLFERHLRSHEAELKSNTDQPAQYNCDLCSKFFFQKQYHTFHMEGHQGKVNITCDFCSVRVPYPEIEAHVRTHTDKIFSCIHCTFCCSNRDKFLHHLRYHGTGRLECDVCAKPHYSRDKLLEHLYTEHQLGVKYTCEGENCQKEFFIKDQLHLHRKIHTDPHVCPYCGKVYGEKAQLNYHLRIHTKDLAHHCSECQVSFHIASDLRHHRIVAHGADKFKCDQCDKEYVDAGGLRAHRTTHDGTGIPCGKCDKVFETKTRWRRHQVAHSTERSFICEECGKGFTSQQTLKSHAKTHGGEKKFKCQFCEKTFLFSKYLVNHERVHTGERPYTCEICGQSFTQSGPLLLHKGKAHPDHCTESKESQTKMKVAFLI